MPPVKVVPYDAAWGVLFSVESQKLERALQSLTVRIHHVGSTAIPGMAAKPIIDLLLEVEDISAIDVRAADIEARGYEAKGEFGIPGRRYFRKQNADGVRTHHLHAFQTRSGHIERHLAFRDYMRAHPADAALYADLKRNLAERHPHDIEAYMDGKDEFVRTFEAKALLWRSG